MAHCHDLALRQNRESDSVSAGSSMKIIFQADNEEALLSVVRTFAELVCENNSISREDQQLLDDLLHGLKRLVKRIEKLDASYPPEPGVFPVS